MITSQISFAFQPIADSESGNVFAYEALVRGLLGESAGQVFAAVGPDRLPHFDHEARLSAVELAGRLGLCTKISLNLLPSSVDARPDCLEVLLAHALDSGIAPEQLLIEVTEGEVIQRPQEFIQLLNQCRADGVHLAIDDFGAGYSGLNLLADFQPDLIKLDMHLVRDIDRAGPRQAIARGILQVCDDLGIEVIAEGVETVDEYYWLKWIGVRLFQGYLLGRPAFESLDEPVFPQPSPGGQTRVEKNRIVKA